MQGLFHVRILRQAGCQQHGADLPAFFQRNGAGCGLLICVNIHIFCRVIMTID
jgi:hypothetical protein